LSASKAYLKATELDPKSAIAHYRYAEVMYKLREWATAMESYERALALDTTGATVNRKQARERANEAAKKLGLRKDN
jgi:Tfp pilus assembly protein PilF